MKVTRQFTTPLGTQVKRTNYFDDGFIVVDLEELDGNLFIHVIVEAEPTVSLIRYMKSIWEMVQNDAYLSGYDDIFCYTPNHKYMKLMDKDFLPVKDLEDGQKVYHKELTNGN